MLYVQTKNRFRKSQDIPRDIIPGFPYMFAWLYMMPFRNLLCYSWLYLLKIHIVLRFKCPYLSSFEIFIIQKKGLRIYVYAVIFVWCVFDVIVCFSGSDLMKDDTLVPYCVLLSLWLCVWLLVNKSINFTNYSIDLISWQVQATRKDEIYDVTLALLIFMCGSSYGDDMLGIVRIWSSSLN